MDRLFDPSQYEIASVPRSGKIEAHHGLWPAAWWTIYEPAARLRNYRETIPRIDRLAHTALHKLVTVVPLPDYRTLERVAKEFTPVVGDPISSIERLRDTFDVVTLRPDTNSLQRNLAGLTMNALDLQLKFIMDGLVK